jgi:2-dehydro-3-deoxygluconokinase
MVSYDTNLRLRLWPLDRARAVIHAAAGLADILRPSLDDARQLTGLDDADKIADFYLSVGPKIVAMTLGAEGALIAARDKRERIAPSAAKLVDATGAGDMFTGAFLAEYLRTGDAFAAGSYANVAAALSTEGYGAVAPMPKRAAVEAAMSGRVREAAGGRH